MITEPVLRIVCCYCAALRKADPTVMQEGDPGAHTSHSICQPCLRILGIGLAIKERSVAK